MTVSVAKFLKTIFKIVLPMFQKLQLAAGFACKVFTSLGGKMEEKGKPNLTTFADNYN